MGGSNSSDNDVKAALKQPNRLVIDCRSPSEFSNGDGFAGAINIPVDLLESRLTEVQPKERTILTYCAAGARAARAADILKAHGYMQVYSTTNAAHIRNLLKS